MPSCIWNSRMSCHLMGCTITSQVQTWGQLKEKFLCGYKTHSKFGVIIKCWPRKVYTFPIKTSPPELLLFHNHPSPNHHNCMPCGHLPPPVSLCWHQRLLLLSTVVGGIVCHPLLVACAEPRKIKLECMTDLSQVPISIVSPYFSGNPRIMSLGERNWCYSNWIISVSQPPPPLTRWATDGFSRQWSSVKMLWDERARGKAVRQDNLLGPAASNSIR